MLLPLSWVNDYIKIDDVAPETLAAKLVEIGFEVEAINFLGLDIKNVVVGQILSIEKHPNADKLRICRLNVGENAPLTIITGADNVNEGDIVPVAKDGAELPGGKRITAGNLRGILSCGMLCSGSELNIDETVIDGAEVDGILVLPKDFAIGADITAALKLHDCILDISIPANRPDCHSVYGMCRELSALLKRKLRPLKLDFKASPYAGERMPTVTVEDETLCPKYRGSLIADVKVGPSPTWLRRRLGLVNVRPLNNVVDITNYVLMEVGQPLHAFDLDCLCGNISVRKAKSGEELTALNGDKYRLGGEMLVISDREKPLAIAGVMGGEASGVKTATQNIFLETARFSKGTVRHTSKALGLKSESSAKYERGVDYFSFTAGRLRALSLFSQLKCGTIIDISVEDGVMLPPERIVKTSAKQIASVLGVTVSTREITAILRRLGIETVKQKEILKCRIPDYREDIDNFADLAEEVVRFYGYDKLPETYMPAAAVTAGGLSDRQKRLEEIKEIMTGAGFYETMSFSFIGENAYRNLSLPCDNAIRISNPLSEEYAIMRTQLVSSMLTTVKTNLGRRNNEFRLFELANVYLPLQLPLTGLPAERPTLCACMVGKEDFFDLKGVMQLLCRGMDYVSDPSQAGWLHPGMSADLKIKGKIFASFGQLHPLIADNFGIKQSVYIMEMDLEPLLYLERQPVRFCPLPKYPSVERDLAVTVDDGTPVGEILAAIKAASPLVTEVKLFDIYRGSQVEKGKKSVAVSLVMQSLERTMTEDEINGVTEGIFAMLSNRYKAARRI